MNYVITGASSGIGRAIAIRLATPDNRLLLVARRRDLLNELSHTISQTGCSVYPVVANLESVSDVRLVASHVGTLLEYADVVIHNAGRGNYASVQDTSEEMWRRMFAINVDAPFCLTQRLLPAMLERNSGTHVYVSSMAGKIGYPYNAAYVAAKHALVGFVASLRAELVGTNVNATVVCPSGVASEWSASTEGGTIDDLYAKAIPRSREIARNNNLPLAPLKKMITSETAAQIILDSIAVPPYSDVYTHDGTAELAALAATDRNALEHQHRALWLAMREVYDSTHRKD